MKSYPKKILSVQQQIQHFKDAGLAISSDSEAENALCSIGFYRLRGYLCHLYDKDNKKYSAGAKFSDVIALYDFDSELSHILFSFLSRIEIALRARFISALLTTTNDALSWLDPSEFHNKKIFWQNLGVIASEIARSKDAFIKHNYDKHEGLIPLWAAVEVTSFGTLSKLIKNMRTDRAFIYLAQSYKFRSEKGKTLTPSHNLFSSWTHACSVFRNICAHNGRLCNRNFSVLPQLLNTDKKDYEPRGLYSIILSMKYLRPSDDSWVSFVNEMKNLFASYEGKFDLSYISFREDWEKYLRIM